MNAEVWKRPTPGKPRGIAAIAAVGEIIGESLRNRRLFDGRSERSMTRDDLLKLAADFEDRATTLRELASKKRPPRKKVASSAPA